MNKQIIDGVDILKEKINICFILLINKLETPEIIEQTIYDHLDAFVEEWNKQLEAKQQENERLKEKLKNYEIQEDFNKCQKAQNRFVKEQLNSVFNNLRERDIAVIRGMNKIECKNKECEVE